MSTLATLTSNESGASSLTDINANFSALNTDKAETASPTFTGTPTLPTGTVATTQTVTDSSTKLATTAFVQNNKVGYTLNAMGSSFNPADSTSYYLGNYFSTVIDNTPDQRRIYFPKAGTIKTAQVAFLNGGTLGTTETSSVYIRLNNTTDTVVTSAATNDAVNTHFFNGALSITVTTTDYFEIKWTSPAWSTNPTTVRVAVNIYIE